MLSRGMYTSALVTKEPGFVWKIESFYMDVKLCPNRFTGGLIFAVVFEFGTFDILETLL